MALPVALGLASAGIGALQAVGGLIGARGQQKKATEAVEGIGTYKMSPEALSYLQEAKQRVGTGYGAIATDIAKQGIGASAAQATRAALMSGKGGGLGLIGAIQKQQARSFQDWARQSAQAENINLSRLGQATQLYGMERARQFASEQEKQQLKANIELEKVAAKRAMLSQGLSGLMSGLSTAAMAGLGTKNPTTTTQTSSVTDTLVKPKFDFKPSYNFNKTTTDTFLKPNFGFLPSYNFNKTT
jgi:hypothetical protein